MSFFLPSPSPVDRDERVGRGGRDWRWWSGTVSGEYLIRKRERILSSSLIWCFFISVFFLDLIINK